MVHGSPGGIGRVERLLSLALDQPDWDVETIRRMSYPRYLDSAAPRNDVVHPGKVRWSLAIASAFLRRRHDIVVLNHINFSPLAILFRVLKPSVRMVVLAYGVDAWQRPGLLRWLGLRVVDQVWSISRYTADRLTAVTGIDPNRVIVIPLALPPQSAQALAGLSAPEDSSIEVLTVSRLWHGEDKGVDHLIQALVAVQAVRLVIVGDGDDRPRLERLAEELGLRARVTFAGSISDQELCDLYGRCSIFALPSLQEGFGLVFLEAMLAGKPVIAASAGATPEVVQDGETGVLVAYGDAHALADAIETLVNDSERARQLGRRGRQLALREFSFERFSTRVYGLLTGLVRPLAYGLAPHLPPPPAGEGRGGGDRQGMSV